MTNDERLELEEERMADRCPARVAVGVVGGGTKVCDGVLVPDSRTLTFHYRLFCAKCGRVWRVKRDDRQKT